MDSKTVSFRRAILEYWKQHGRHSLPWRRTKDPYKILVSEIMLQQTQVDRVVPYFERFLKRFPTVRALAHAPLSDVLKEWSGLGYNRRARLLRECAKEIVEKHGGRVPKDAAALRALPGVGSYTAGAIRAFAFDEPDIFIETNIRAALLHHFFPRAKKVPDAKLAPILRKLLKGVKSPREWYSALMDYGTHLKKTHPNPSRQSAHHVKQTTFEGSVRQVRGEILKHLIANRSLDGISQSHLFVHAIASLKQEGLLEKRRGKWTIVTN